MSATSHLDAALAYLLDAEAELEEAGAELPATSEKPADDTTLSATSTDYKGEAALLLEELRDVRARVKSLADRL